MNPSSAAVAGGAGPEKSRRTTSPRESTEALRASTHQESLPGGAEGLME